MSEQLDSAIYQLRLIDKAIELNMLSAKEMFLNSQGKMPDKLYTHVANAINWQLSDDYIESVSDTIETVRTKLESQGDYSKKTLYINSKAQITSDKFGRLLTAYAAIQNISDHFGSHAGLQEVSNNVHKILRNSVKELSTQPKALEQRLGIYLEKVEQINAHKEAIFMGNIIIACKDISSNSIKIIEDDPHLNMQLRKDLSHIYSYLNTAAHKLDTMVGFTNDQKLQPEDNGYFMQCYKSITTIYQIARYVQRLENREDSAVLYKYKFPQEETESLKTNLSSLKQKAVNHIAQITETLAEPLREKKADICMN